MRLGRRRDDSIGARLRADALGSMRERDWRGVYENCKAWTSRGGAWLPEAQLIYGTSPLFKGEPRTAAHHFDTALKVWIAEPLDRAVIHWARGQVIRLRMNDPRSALPDFEAAAAALPDWLTDDLCEARDSCRAEADVSRVRKPRFGPPPEYGVTFDLSFVDPDTSGRSPGECPAVWPELRDIYSERP